jgi:hypothetical protein
MVATLEDRLVFVEVELARLKQLLEREHTPAPADQNAAPESVHPLAPLAGRLRDHPLLDTWREIVEEQRSQLDEAEGVT